MNVTSTQRVQPVTPPARTRKVTREKPIYVESTKTKIAYLPVSRTETDPTLERLEKAGDLIAQGLVTLLWVVVPAVVIAQVGFRLGWW